MSEPMVTMTKRQANALAEWAHFGRYIAFDLWGPNMPICRQLAPLNTPISVMDDIVPHEHHEEEMERE